MKTCLLVLIALAVAIVSVTSIVVPEATVSLIIKQGWDSIAEEVNNNDGYDYGIKHCLDELQKDWSQLTGRWSSYMAYCCAFRRALYCIGQLKNDRNPNRNQTIDKLVTNIVAATQRKMIPDINCYLYRGSSVTNDDIEGIILCKQLVWVVISEFILLFVLLMMVLYMITNLVNSYHRQLTVNTVRQSSLYFSLNPNQC